MDELEMRLTESAERVMAQKLALGVAQIDDVKRQVSARTTTHRKSRVIAGAAGTLIVSSILLTGFTHPSLLNIGRVFNLLVNGQFTQPSIRLATQKGYSQPVNQSSTSSGITLTIGHIYTDAEQFEFDMVESFMKQASNKPVIHDNDITIDIDGKRRIDNFSGGNFRLVDGDRYAGVIWDTTNNLVSHEPLPLRFTMNIHVSRIGNVRGNWNFAIPVSRVAAAKGTDNYTIQKSVLADGLTLTVQRVTVEPAETRVYYRLMQPVSGANRIDIRSVDDIVLHNQNGKRLSGQLSLSDPSVINGQRLIDAVGTYQNEDGEPTTLQIQGMTSRVYTQLAGRYPASFEPGPDTHFTVTGVDVSATKTNVHLEVKANDHAIRGGVFFWLRSATGEVIQSHIVDVEPQTHAVVAVFPKKIDLHRSWTLWATDSHLVPGLSLQVHLH